MIAHRSRGATLPSSCCTQVRGLLDDRSGASTCVARIGGRRSSHDLLRACIVVAYGLI